MKILGPWAGIQYIRTVMKAGQALRTLPIWKSEKLGIMEEIVLTKFHSCWAFREKLLFSGEALLEEDTSMLFWGANYNYREKRYGDNQLGQLLMRLRYRSRSLCEGGTGDYRLPQFRPYPVGIPPYVQPRIPRDLEVSRNVFRRMMGDYRYEDY